MVGAAEEGPPEYVGIGELARALNRSPVTLRRWERVGLLPPPGHRSRSHSTRGERRLYTRSEVAALQRAALRSSVLYLEDGRADYVAFAALARQALRSGTG